MKTRGIVSGTNELRPLEELPWTELRLRARALIEGLDDAGEATASAREIGEIVEELCARHARLEGQNRALRDARAESERANRMKDEFLGIVSHELRTPLSALVGWCHILTSRVDEPGLVERGVQALRRNTDALRRLVDDILDVSRIISGKLSVEMHRTEMEQVVRASLDLARTAAEAKGVRLEISIAPDCIVMGDSQRLQQVVWNLLSNAMKFTAAGGSVDVALERRGAVTRLTVRDDGCGIDPGDLPHVFERFRQAAWSSTRAHSGLGLGLAIARHIVEAHGGRIAAESEGYGQGATFTVDLPAKPLSIPPPGLPRPHPARDALAGRRVLFVDDEPDTLEVTALALGALGAEVRTATSVDEAMTVLASFAPHAIVSDVAMPRRDGYDLIRDVRSMPAPLSGVPTIALTAHARPDDAARALRAGFISHLAKPVDTDVLADVIATVVARAL